MNEPDSHRYNAAKIVLFMLGLLVASWLLAMVAMIWGFIHSK